MSLACLECGHGGEFDTMICRVPAEGSIVNCFISHLPNYYTCCARIDDFKPVDRSEYIIAVEAEAQGSWCTGNDGPQIKDTKFKFISEEDLKKKLPKIYSWLVRKKFN